MRLLCCLNIADILLTKHLTDLGAKELNPIINYLLSINFVWALGFKLVMLTAIMLLISNLRGRVSSVRLVVVGANIFFSLLVAYQLIGIIVLS